MTTTQGKPIHLSQLAAEMTAASKSIPYGLGMAADQVYTYDAEGNPQALPDGSQAVIDAHVAMRDKNDAELAAEFQATSDPVRKQDIRDMQSGLMPREQVPM